MGLALGEAAEPHHSRASFTRGQRLPSSRLILETECDVVTDAQVGEEGVALETVLTGRRCGGVWDMSTPSMTTF